MSLAKQVNTALVKAGFKYSSKPIFKEWEETVFLYIKNTDGSLRWVWPAKNPSPDVLRFYHCKGIRATVFSLFIRLIFLMRLQTLVFGKMKMFGAPENPHRWALFTGTVGPNRKMILWTKENGTAFFTKIPLTATAAGNIAKEAAALRFTEARHYQWIDCAEADETGEALLKIKALPVTQKTNRLASLPINALLGWCEPAACKPVQSLAWWAPINTFLHTTITDKRIPQGLVEKLRALYHQNSGAEKTIAVAPMHGDFTPWNVWPHRHQLCMIDMELFEKEAPCLFDVFHFVYQKNILLGNKGYQYIRKELDTFFEKPIVKDFLVRHQLNTKELEQLYLLRNICFHLELYSNQPQWHMQVNWLLHTWNEALTAFLPVTNYRQAFLRDLGIALHDLPYAAMKFEHEKLEQLSEYSDLDVCISREGYTQLMSRLRHHPHIKTIATRRFHHLSQLSFCLVDGSLVHLDCIFRFVRKHTVFMSATEVLQQATVNAHGIALAAPEHNYTYIWLFHWLNKVDIPQRCITSFREMSYVQQQKVNQYLLKEWGIHDFTALAGKRLHMIQAVKQQLKSRFSAGFFRQCNNRLLYAMDVIKKLVPRKGIVITFTGVDGAGKTTVITAVKHSLEKKFRRRVIIRRHRPSVLPILSAWKYGKAQAEERSVATLPRQGNNKGLLSSVVRFCYYYCDYILGQWYVYLRYVMAGYVVVYDRYYFDFISDSKRSNIVLPKKFTGWLYRFLLKPEFNFLLYAQPEEILKRKRELDEKTILQLTGSYRQLFAQLNQQYKRSSYTALLNNDLQTTITTIENIIYHGSKTIG